MLYKLTYRIMVLVVAAAVVGLLPHAQAQDDEQAPSITRPKYKVLRYKEDWSVLAGEDTSATGDFWDPIKYVPLNDDGSIWVSFGGQARLRFENWDNFGFSNASGRDDSFLLTRLLFHADLHIGENIRVFVQGKSAFSTDNDAPVGNRGLEVDELDLQNGFVDWTIPLAGGDAAVTLRAGRQELLFGKQRLVSPLDWANSRRTFDGFSGILTHGNWTVTGFFTRTVPVQKYDFNDQDANTDFYGIYITGKCPTTGIGLDLYWLALDTDAATFNTTTASEERHTLGGRIFGKLSSIPVDYDVEGAYQFGDFGSNDIDAYMIAAEIGYTYEGGPCRPRFHLGVDYASGDDAVGGDLQTFNQLFPLGHTYLGWIDMVGRQNIIDVSPGVTFKPLKKMVVKLNGHFYWRAEENDALYNAGSIAVRGGALASDRRIGTELDLSVQYKFDRHLTGLFGYSHFFTDDFIENSGPHSDIDFVYVSMQYTF